MPRSFTSWPTVVAAVLLFLPSLAMGSIVRALDLTELTASADRIVVADVLSVASTWDDAHRNIHTTVEIGVRERWKGDVPGNGRMTLRQLGGTVGDIEMSVVGAAKFVPGERTLLFLHRSQVVGMAQGKRNLRWESAGRRWIVEPADRAQTMTFAAGGKLRAAPPRAAEPLDDVRSEVAGLVAK
jgi:hypothetical protein